MSLDSRSDTLRSQCDHRHHPCHIFWQPFCNGRACPQHRSYLVFLLLACPPSRQFRLCHPLGRRMFSVYALGGSNSYAMGEAHKLYQLPKEQLGFPAFEEQSKALSMGDARCPQPTVARPAAKPRAIFPCPSAPRHAKQSGDISLQNIQNGPGQRCFRRFWFSTKPAAQIQIVHTL